MTRMDGAKQAVIEMLTKLRQDDRLAIFVFDDVVEMLVRPTSISSTEALDTVISKVNTLQPRTFDRHRSSSGTGRSSLQRNGGRRANWARSGSEPLRAGDRRDGDTRRIERRRTQEEGEIGCDRSQLHDSCRCRTRLQPQSFGETRSETGGMFFYADSGENWSNCFAILTHEWSTSPRFQRVFETGRICWAVKLAAVFGSGITVRMPR